MNTSNWKKDTIKFLSAQTISLLGSSLVQYAIIWYITLQTSSGKMMTIATICGFLPQILISLFAGVWIDRYNRKVMIMLADGMIAFSTLCIALLFIAGYKDITLLFIVLLIRSAGAGVQTPAVNALIPQLVPKEHLMKVNGFNSTIQSLMMFVSPAISGAILSFISIELTFFIDIITAIIAIIIMVSIHVERIKRKVEEKEDVLKDIRYGFSYVKEHKQIKNQLLYLIVIMIFISPAAFLTPLLVTRAFGAEVWRLTVSEMVFGFGAIGGGILISAWGGFKNRMHTVLFATTFYGAMMLGIGCSPIFIVYLFFNCLIGISMPCFNSPVTVMLQENVEPYMHGRIFSILQIANSCALPIGTILFGPLADYMEVQTVFLLTGTIVILTAIYAYFSKVLISK